jgi:hypothetical protein
MVQSEFNLIFWFVSYNIFFVSEIVGPTVGARALSPRAWRAASSLSPVMGPAHIGSPLLRSK